MRSAESIYNQCLLQERNANVNITITKIIAIAINQARREVIIEASNNAVLVPQNEWVNQYSEYFKIDGILKLIDELK